MLVSDISVRLATLSPSHAGRARARGGAAAHRAGLEESAAALFCF